MGLINKIIPFKRGAVREWVKKHPRKVLVSAILLLAYYFCLPKDLFVDPTATVIESKNGKLLGAMIADDGQWRFPEVDSVPFKFKTCIIQFEDAYFYRHPGFNPISMAKAVAANIKAGKSVRGGSTLTQQVIRLSRKGKKRTYWEKAIELVLATRLELRHTKEEIIGLYASHAPFGGNVVGLDVAAWRFFGLQAHQLSWAESATLAVLPNAPSLIYPGKNQRQLLQKRNRLLRKLFENGILDHTTYEMALLEKLPRKPYPLPKLAPHLVHYLARSHKGERITSTIDENLQSNVNVILNKHYQNLKQNQVHNAAALVLDVHTRQVLAYIGNTPTDKDHQKDVDMVHAIRSTGSTLKPLLYAAMMDAGELLPNMLVPDVPTQIAGYRPENFNEDYSGAVEAKKALARSLNIPAVRLLQKYGLERFRDQLNAFHMKGIDKPADYYGLTLILGGAESNLWDLCKTYASMASTINHFNTSSSEYFDQEFTNLSLIKDHTIDFGRKSTEKTIFDAGSIYLTFEAMKEVNRPQGNESWEFFDSSKEIAWKTGTSFGNKDAWAIGTTKDYVVGIWVGNADGEGRPNVTGVSSAAPILFDVFDVLPKSDWFEKPLDEFVSVEVCRNSGFLATKDCPKKTISIPDKNNYVEACKYHRMVLLDQQKQFRVNSSCADISSSYREPWFVLPPLMAFYYKKSHPTYKNLPPFKKNCKNALEPTMEFIYPKNNAQISLTKNFEGNLNELVLNLAHTKPETSVYWYLDEKYLGQTNDFHELGILPTTGKHTIIAIDELGNEAKISIQVK